MMDADREDVPLVPLEIEGNESPKDSESIPPWSTLITFRGVIASALIGIIYSVVVMKLNLTTGVVPNLNVSASLLAYLLVQFWIKLLQKCDLVSKPFTKQENTVIQTCAVACYSIATGGGFGSYLLGLNKKTYEQAGVDTPGNVPGSHKELKLNWIIQFLFFSTFVGLFVLVPFGKIMIIEKKLPYPSGTATAVLINGLHKPKEDKDAKKQVWGFVKYFSFSFLWSFFKWFYSGGAQCGFSNFPTLGLQAWKHSFNFDFSMAYVGAGMISSHIVNLSLLIGAIASWGIMWPLIGAHKGSWYPATLPEDSMKSLNGYKVFISIALILGDGLYNLLKTLRTCIFPKMNSKTSQDIYVAAQKISLAAQEISVAAAQNISVAAQKISAAAQDISAAAQDIYAAAQDISATAQKISPAAAQNISAAAAQNISAAAQNISAAAAQDISAEAAQNLSAAAAQNISTAAQNISSAVQNISVAAQNISAAAAQNIFAAATQKIFAVAQDISVAAQNISMAAAQNISEAAQNISAAAAQDISVAAAQDISVAAAQNLSAAAAQNISVAAQNISVAAQDIFAAAAQDIFATAAKNISAAAQNISIAAAPETKDDKNLEEKHQQNNFFIEESIPMRGGVGYCYLVFVVIATVIIRFMFPEMKWYFVLVAYALALVLSYFNAYGAGLTDINMAYSYGEVAVFIFAFSSGTENGVVAGLVGCGLIKTIVSISSDLMHDFKTGHLTLTSPKAMLLSQAVGTAMGCVVAPLSFFLFYKTFDVGNPDGEYKAPYAIIYRNMAILGIEGFSTLPQHCLHLCYGFFVFAMVANLLKDSFPENVGEWIPLPMAMAVPFLVGASFAIDMCMGSLVVYTWHRLNSKKATLMVPVVASGLICGDGLWILPQSILALAKIKPPICMNFLPAKAS